ncbi:MAG: hypothetical protein H0S79_23190 [Anaerolineaceae bacterium]|nr:hypothetical protein [Anaerolineaceae bacterium]
MKTITKLLPLLVVVMLLAACGQVPVEQVESANLAASTPTPGGANVSDAGETALTETPFLDLVSFFSTDYEDSTSARNQFALGTLYLTDTSIPITAEQAQQILPLWQAILVLDSNPDSAAEELNAVQNQLVGLMTQEQLQAIAAMQVTNTQLAAFYADLGIIMGTENPDRTPGSGQGGGNGGDPAAREATQTAAQALGTPVGSGSSSGQDRKNVLTEAVIDALLAIVNN